jgi:hypothetical protein
LSRSPSAVSEARISPKMRVGAKCSGALSIQRLEGNRPWLRRTRALWELNGVEGRCRAVRGWCGGAQKTTPCAREPIATRDGRYRSVWKSEKKRLTWRPDAEGRSVAKHAKFSGCGRRCHAVTVTGSGGDRSWIWAAVNLSMVAIGPPHLGQYQRSLALAVEACCVACGCGVEPSN